MSSRMCCLILKLLARILCTDILPKAMQHFLVVSFYPPLCSKVGKFDELQDVLSFLEALSQDIIITGDTTVTSYKL